MANGRLRIKGGQPTQGALQISSASLVDPSTGDFDLDLPTQAVDSVEVMANPFAAEYGRFSTSITQIRTRGGTNDWDFSIGNLVPRFRGLLRGVRGFEPRASVRGPIRKDRLFLAQDFQFRYVATPVKSLPDEPEVVMRSFDSFTRLDNVMSARHVLSGALIMFPREIDRVTMNTFRPAATTPEWRQEGWSAGGVDRLAISAGSGARVHALTAAVSRSRSTATTMPRWSTRPRRRAAASSTIRNATCAATSGLRR